MKSFLTFLLFCWAVLAVYFYLNNNPAPLPPQEKPFINPAPEPNREIHSFNWDSMTYIYKDQVPPDRGMPRREYDPYPDGFIDYLDRAYEREDNREKIVIIGNKRYRVLKKENREYQLIPISHEKPFDNNLHKR